MKQLKHYPPKGPRLYIGFSTEGKEEAISYERRLLIRSAIAETLFYERVFFDAEVSVTLCDDAYIKTLNEKSCVLMIGDEFPPMSDSEWLDALTNGMDIHISPEVVTKALARYFSKTFTIKVKE